MLYYYRFGGLHPPHHRHPGELRERQGRAARRLPDERGPLLIITSSN